jgi:hypothetical protein
MPGPAREFSSRRRTLPIISSSKLSGVRKRPMIRSMPTTARPQQRYDHRLRNLVQRTGDVTVATDLGVPLYLLKTRFLLRRPEPLSRHGLGARSGAPTAKPPGGNDNTPAI